MDAQFTYSLFKLNMLNRTNTLLFDDDEEIAFTPPRSLSSASSDSDSPYNFFSTRSNPPQRQQNQQEIVGLLEKLVDRLQQTLKEGLEKQTTELKKIITDQPRIQQSSNSNDDLKV